MGNPKMLTVISDDVSTTMAQNKSLCSRADVRVYWIKNIHAVR